MERRPARDAYVFFSSRRRHTRCLSDWSSDVCSSDLDNLRRAVDPLVVGYGDVVHTLRLHSPSSAHRRGRSGDPFSTGPQSCVSRASLTRPVTLLVVLLHYASGGIIFGTLAIPAALLRGFLDVFVFSLLLRTYTSQVLFSWHIFLL